jgi:enoyl-CoA hydratase/carnithine racemase
VAETGLATLRVVSDDPVLLDRHGAVALLTLNRPERLNAWNGALESRFFELLDACGSDEGVRAIVVTGAGRGFCAGADMDLLQDIGRDAPAAGPSGPSPAGRRPQWYTATFPKPVVAAINGACAGIGLVMAVMCDVRFAAAGAKFTTAFARRGLIAEHGISWMLPQLVGRGVATDLLLSGRVFLAEEAERIGLVNAVLPAEHLVEHALAYADDLATNCSPTSMAVMKRQLLDDAPRSLVEAFDASLPPMAESLRSEDFREGVQSYLQKRPPSFAPFPAPGAP